MQYEETLWSRYGCGWASKYASGYNKNAPEEESGGAVIENQSFFGADGKALKSLIAFSEGYDPESDTVEEELTPSGVTVDSTEIVLDSDEKLTADMLGNGRLHYTNGSAEKAEVQWNTSDIDAVNAADTYGKKFTVHGEADGITVTRQATRLWPDILTNSGFESGSLEGWSVSDGSSGKITKTKKA